LELPFIVTKEPVVQFLRSKLRFKVGRKIAAGTTKPTG